MSGQDPVCQAAVCSTRCDSYALHSDRRGVATATVVVGRVGNNPAEDWAVLLLANLAGIFVIAPFLRAWVERRSSGVARLREWLALVAVAIGLSTVVDAAVLGATGSSAYVVFPVVV